MNVIEQAAAGCLDDLPTTFSRDQNAAILRDRLRDFGLDPSDPAIVQGALAGLLIVRDQLMLSGLVRELLAVPEMLGAVEGLSVMIDQHRRTRQ